MPTHATPHRYQELARWIEEGIDTGSLKAGARIPSVRMVARQRGVSIATVVQAFRTLEDRGILEARPKSGYYVREQPCRACAVPRMASSTPRPTSVDIGGLAARIMREANDPGLVALGAGCPSPDIHPHERLARLLGAAARERSRSLTSYQIANTEPELAAALARRALLHGYTMDPAGIVATSGCLEALNIALRAVTRPGDVVVVESPTFFNFLEIIESLGLKTIEVPVCPVDGVSLEAVQVALENHPVRACLFMPNGQNPLGCTMSDENKRALLALCEDYGVPVIEDDIYGEVTFAERRPHPLQAFDKTGNVILCSSVSKTLAPGLRVGWISPGRHLERVLYLRAITSMTTPTVSQLAVARFMAGGGFDHYLRGTRAAYQSQAQQVARAVLEHFPEGVRLSRPTGGFFLWVELPAGFDSLHFHEEALAAGISIAPGVIFSARRRFKNCLRLNCSMRWCPQIEEAIATLGRLATEHLKRAR